MSERPGPPRPVSPVTWRLFGVASTLVLGACVVAAMSLDSWPRALMVLIGGVVAVGLAGLWTIALASPMPGYRAAGQRRPGQGMVIASGGGAGSVADGGSGGGGCGVDGGGC